MGGKTLFTIAEACSEEEESSGLDEMSEQAAGTLLQVEAVNHQSQQSTLVPRRRRKTPLVDEPYAYHRSDGPEDLSFRGLSRRAPSMCSQDPAAQTENRDRTQEGGDVDSTQVAQTSRIVGSTSSGASTGGIPGHLCKRSMVAVAKRRVGEAPTQVAKTLRVVGSTSTGVSVGGSRPCKRLMGPVPSGGGRMCSCPGAETGGDREPTGQPYSRGDSAPTATLSEVVGSTEREGAKRQIDVEGGSAAPCALVDAPTTMSAQDPSGGGPQSCGEPDSETLTLQCLLAELPTGGPSTEWRDEENCIRTRRRGGWAGGSRFRITGPRRVQSLSVSIDDVRKRLTKSNLLGSSLLEELSKPRVPTVSQATALVASRPWPRPGPTDHHLRRRVVREQYEAERKEVRDQLERASPSEWTPEEVHQWLGNGGQRVPMLPLFFDYLGCTNPELGLHIWLWCSLLLAVCELQLAEEPFDPAAVAEAHGLLFSGQLARSVEERAGLPQPESGTEKEERLKLSVAMFGDWTTAHAVPPLGPQRNAWARQALRELYQECDLGEFGSPPGGRAQAPPQYRPAWSIDELDETDPLLLAADLFDQRLREQAWGSRSADLVDVLGVETRGVSRTSLHVWGGIEGNPEFELAAPDRRCGTKIYVDTGAATSIIGADMVELLGLSPTSCESRRRFLRTASGEFMRVGGQVTVVFKLSNGHVYSHVCEVVPKFAFGLLLGNDFLHERGACVDFGRANVRFEDHMPVPAYCTKEGRHEGLLGLAADMQLPPSSRNILAVQVLPKVPMPIWYQDGNTVEVEPNDDLTQSKGLKVARSWGVLTCEGGETPFMCIQVVNPHPHPVRVRAGEVLGRMAQPEVLKNGRIALLNPDEGDTGRRTVEPDVVPPPENCLAVTPVAEVPKPGGAVRKVVDTQGTKSAFRTMVEAMRAEDDKMMPPGTDIGGPGKKAQFEKLNAHETDDERVERIKTHASLGPKLTDAQKEEMTKALLQEAPVFSDSPGFSSLAELEIDTGNARPVAKKPYRNPLVANPAFLKQLEQWEDMHIIRRSNSAWAAPVLVVPKKDGAFRTVVDYRGLNSKLRKEENPVPRISDVLDSMGGAKFFSTMDLTSGYYQLGVKEADRHKTAFTTPFGLYEFNRCPQGISNAVPTFQRTMELLLRGLLGVCVLVYLDDIIVYSQTFDQHVKELKSVLARVREAGMTLKLRKCRFGWDSVEYLGHMITDQGIRVCEDKVLAVRAFPVPTGVTKVRSFLGIANFYRRFIRGFSLVARPLYDLTKKAVPFHWGRPEQDAFDGLKDALTTAPVLVHPDFAKPFELHVDASDYGGGAALVQRDEKNCERPVAYWSLIFNSAQRNYSTIEREALAMIKALEYFRPYLFGRPVTVLTDHSPLQWLMKTNPSGRLARWALTLYEYDLNIVYRKGTDNTDADGLSRAHAPEPELHRWSTRPVQEESLAPDDEPSAPIPEATDDDAVPILVVGAEDDPVARVAGLAENPWRGLEREQVRDALRQAQHDDPFCGPLITRMEAPDVAEGSRAEKRWVSRAVPNFELCEGVLYRRKAPSTLAAPVGDRLLLVVPDPLKPAMLRVVHDDPVSGGHLGITKAYTKLMERYWWRGMYRDVASHCISCTECASGKGYPQSTRYSSIPLPDRPFQLVGVDTVGPLPETAAGNKYIVVVTDYLTRWSEAVATPTCEAAEAARVLMEQVVCRHGFMESLISDNGSQYVNEVIAELCAMGRVKHITAPAYHPETNGLTERYNRTLKSMLKMYVREDQTDWDKFLPFVQFAYRTSYQESMRCSPFGMLYGREATLPLDPVLLEPRPDLTSGSDYRVLLREALNRRYTAARNYVAQAQLKQRKENNRELLRPLQELTPRKLGDLVWVHSEPLSKEGRNASLVHAWRGPYEVVRRTGNSQYVVEARGPAVRNDRRLDRFTVHITRMKTFHERAVTPPPGIPKLEDLQAHLPPRWPDGEHNNTCNHCDYGGELVLCDFCNLVYHTSCVSSLDGVPDGDWACPECFLDALSKARLAGDVSPPNLAQQAWEYYLRSALVPADVHRQVADVAIPAAVPDGGLPQQDCLLYTSPSPRDQRGSRMPSSA